LVPLGILAGGTAVALDFVPRPGYRDQEGIKIPIVVFGDGARTFSYEPPPDWKVSGSSRVLTFRTGNPLWEVSWTLAGQRARVMQSDDALKAFALGELPRSATDAVASDIRRNTFILEGMGNTEVRIDYRLADVRYRSCTAVLDLDGKEQLQLRIVAPVKSFDDAYEAMRRSFYSIEWR
jgi:hypothetical protein